MIRDDDDNDVKKKDDEDLKDMYVVLSFERVKCFASLIP